MGTTVVFSLQHRKVLIRHPVLISSRKCCNLFGYLYNIITDTGRIKNIVLILETKEKKSINVADPCFWKISY